MSIDLASGLGSGGEAEDDILSGVEDLLGSTHGDRLSGDSGANDLSGGGGDDLLEGRGGADRLDGGAGRDRAIYEGSAAGVWVDLAAGSGSGGDAAGDILAGIEDVSGSAHADTLLGDAGGNALSGGVGDDRLEGRGGADMLEGGAGEDLASYAGSAAGVLVDIVSGTGTGGDAEGDVLSGIEHLEGSAHADRLLGDAGANLILGGAGDDLLEGRAGADRLEGGSGRDRAVYAGSDAGVWIDLAGGFGSGGEADGDVLDGIEDVSGSAHADTLLGDGGDNALAGGAGDDRLSGGAGADRLDGGDGSDVASYAGSSTGVSVDLASGRGQGGDAEGDLLAGIEHIEGSAHADRLSGDAGANLLSGGGGDDILSGGAGADRLEGGAGRDLADYVTSSGAVWIDLAAGRGHGAEAEGDLLLGIEDLAGSAFADTLLGDAGANRIVGAAGDDWIEGGAGGDVLDGGAGFDTVSYAGSAAGVSVDLATGIAWGGDAAGDTLLSVEGVVGTALADTLAGDGAANLLSGGDGDDVLSGGAGADRLEGGAGRDRAIYLGSMAGVRVDLAAGAGAGGDAEGDVLSGIEDLTGSALADTLAGDGGANRIEGRAGNDRLEGRGGDDILQGGDGDDLLLGGAGADRLEGGSGTDRAGYEGSAAGVRVDLAAGLGSGGDAEGDVLTGIEELAGSGHADTLLGDGGANRLDGRAGDDVLAGGGGADRLDGGAGRDRADYAASLAGVWVDLAAGRGAWGDAEGDLLTGIEDVSGSAHADVLTGDGGSNALIGGGGNDVLSGGAGADHIDGGAGIDTAAYALAGSGVSVDLEAGRGLAGDALGDVLLGVENLTGSAFADVLRGDAGDNLIEGGGGADTIDGGAGFDTASYAGAAGGVSVDLGIGRGTAGEAAGDVLTGIEAVRGSAWGDTLLGGAGADRLDGGGGADLLLGGAGSDTLLGGDGDDRLWGEAGDDRIEGGAGWDGAEYSGNTDGYAIQRLGPGAAIVTDISAVNGWEGTDTLTGVEYLRFADRVVYLDGTNNAPIAGADGGIATDEDSPVVISRASLLANDFDYDADALSIAWVGDAWGGTAALNAAGNVVFTPHANYNGDAGFSYLADDGRGGQARASVQVAVRPVNDAPVAAGESFSTRNDTALTLSQATLLANDRDPDGDPLGVVSVGGAVGGTVAINAAGNVVFTPLASHIGAGGFWYTAADGKGGSASAWVPVEMTPSNRAPVIVGYAPNSHFSSVKDGYLVYDTLTFYDPDQDSRSLTFQVGAAWAWGGGHSGGGDAELPAYVQTSISYDDRGFGYLHLLNQGKFNITVTIRDSGGLSTSYTYWSPPPPVDSKPIVLDMDGDGLELVGLAESVARFDMDGDGTRDRTGWVAADDALLVFDADGDRRASGREEIVIADHGLPGMTDLEALAHAFDSDANRVFDARDEAWSSFGVWQDLDQDGEADDGEYRTLDEAGITSIGLDRAGEPRDIEGNTVYGEARFTTASGETGAIGDVALAYVPSATPAEAGLDRLTEAMALFDAAGMEDTSSEMPPDALWADQTDPAGEVQGGRIFLAAA